MANSKSLQAFVDSVKRWHPGATVWTKGDKAHERSPSDHNNDDTSGVRSEQQDSDNIAEIRAGDVPLLGGVTMAKLDELRRKITDRPANRARSKYVILRQTIWRANGGWVPEVYRGEYHGHLHNSIWASDDNNATPWDFGDAPAGETAPPTDSSKEDDMKIITARYTPKDGPHRSTVWSGLRGLVPLLAHPEMESVNGLVYAGAVQETYLSAEAMVRALGTFEPEDGETPEETFNRTVQAIKDAG